MAKSRYLSQHLLEYAKTKIILLSGPRQVGKTTLSKSLVESYSYYNYDIKDFINVFLKNEWDKTTDLVIFDEIHKMKNWKLWLKGHFDNGHLKKQQHKIIYDLQTLDSICNSKKCFSNNEVYTNTCSGFVKNEKPK